MQMPVPSNQTALISVRGRLVKRSCEAVPGRGDEPLQAEHAQAHVHGLLVEAGYGVVRECEHNPAIYTAPVYKGVG